MKGDDSPDLDRKAIARTVSALIDDHLRAGRICSFTLSTSSMWPAILPGDRVRVRAARLSELRVGDILVRKMDESWIVHRLIGRSANGAEMLLVTKGDNALISDTWPAARLVGAVVAVERAGQQQADILSLEARWKALSIALISRGQLLLSQIELPICRRFAIKITRACLRMIILRVP